MRSKVLWLLAVVLAVLAVGLIPTPAAATSMMPLNLANATIQGQQNVTYGKSTYGTTGIYINQAVETFDESSLQTCEQVWNSAQPATGLGGSSGFSITTTGGRRSLKLSATVMAPNFAEYINTCAFGYNETAQLYISAMLYIDAASNSMRVGWSDQPLTPYFYDACGPFVDIAVTNGAVTSAVIGIGEAGFPGSSWYSSRTSFSIAKDTWFKVQLWQNLSSQTAIIGTTKITASKVWSVSSCNGGSGSPNQQKEQSGAYALGNGTGSFSVWAVDDITIGTGNGYGGGTGTFPKRIAYVQFNAIAVPSKLTELDITALLQPDRVNTGGSTYVSFPSGGVCPCYINSTGGTNLWTHAGTLMQTAYYNLTTWALPVTGVSGGISVNLALRFNSTDALSNTYISSISIPGSQVWQNPAGPGSEVANISPWLPALIFILAVGSMIFMVYMDIRDTFLK